VIPASVYEETLLSFLAPVRPFLDDPSVTEIMINGPSHIYVERGGMIEETNACFASERALLAAVRNIAQYVGRRADEEQPVLEARLPDGSRVQAVLPPLVRCPHLSIRRFPKGVLTMERLVELGSLTSDAAELLDAMVAAKQNIVVAGGTGSGKTSMLNVMSSFIANHERIVVIEDARELNLQKPHVVQMEVRPKDVRGRGEISVRDLFRATLRMRPDRVVIGEIRGPEALDLIQAMTSGHGGCLTTVHATYPADTLHRLETMALMSDVRLPLEALRAQIASAVNIVVQTARGPEGRRWVTHISEVRGYAPSTGYVLSDLFARHQTTDGGSLLKPTTLLPKCYTKVLALSAQGRSFPQLAARVRGSRIEQSGSHAESE